MTRRYPPSRPIPPPADSPGTQTEDGMLRGILSRSLAILNSDFWIGFRPIAPGPGGSGKGRDRDLPTQRILIRLRAQAGPGRVGDGWLRPVSPK
jgi:hypothetical protein